MSGGDLALFDLLNPLDLLDDGFLDDTSGATNGTTGHAAGSAQGDLGAPPWSAAVTDPSALVGGGALASSTSSTLTTSVKPKKRQGDKADDGGGTNKRSKQGGGGNRRGGGANVVAPPADSLPIVLGDDLSELQRNTGGGGGGRKRKQPGGGPGAGRSSGASVSGGSSRMLPPTFYPYAMPMPANFAPSVLRDQAVLRTLRGFKQDPSYFLMHDRQRLLIDLKRAVDMVHNQKDFIERQIQLLDAWKAQAWPEPRSKFAEPASVVQMGGGMLGDGDLADFEFLLDDDNFEDTLEQLGGEDFFDGVEAPPVSLPRGGGGGSAVPLHDKARPSSAAAVAAPGSFLPPPQPPQHQSSDMLSTVGGMLGGDELTVTSTGTQSGEASSGGALQGATIGGNSVHRRYRQVKVTIIVDKLPPYKVKKGALIARMPLSDDEFEGSVEPVKMKGVASGKPVNPVIKAGSPIPTVTSPAVMLKDKGRSAEQQKRSQVKNRPHAPSSKGGGQAGGVAAEVEQQYYDPLDVFADFDWTSSSLWQYIEEASYLTPVLHALGNPTSLPAAERALAELLPFETEEVIERESVSRDVEDGFDDILESTLEQHRLLRADQARPYKAVTPGEEMVWAWAEDGFNRELAMKPLARRLLAALVHPPVLSLASANQLKLTPSTSSSPAAPPSDETQPQDEASKAATAQDVGLTKSEAKSAGAVDHLGMWPLPKSLMWPGGGGDGRGGAEARLMLELEGWGLWDSYAREKTRRIAKAKAFAASGDLSAVRDKVEAKEKLDAELGMWIRQDERMALAKRRSNNHLISKLREHIMEAVKAEFAQKAQAQADKEVVERWEKLEKRKRQQAAQAKAAAELKQQQEMQRQQQLLLLQQQQEEEEKRRQMEQQRLMLQQQQQQLPPPAPPFGGAPSMATQGGLDFFDPVFAVADGPLSAEHMSQHQQQTTMYMPQQQQQQQQPTGHHQQQQAVLMGGHGQYMMPAGVDQGAAAAAAAAAAAMSLQLGFGLGSWT